jgi:ribonuclease HII
VSKKIYTPNLFYEHRLWHAGINNICGVDEVGRGALAGPVMACAVIFKKDYYHPEVLDSKLLTWQKRRYLSEELCEEALDWSIGRATAKEIDCINIRQATFLAMRRAINKLKIRPGYALIDGEPLKDGICKSQGIIKGDNKSFTIAAASIIAKDFRDNYMAEISKSYKRFKFEKNKGYGTKEHIQAIKNAGICKYHRRTFLKKILG